MEDFVDQELSARKIIFGYGRPLASLDERVAYLLCKAEQLDLLQRPHLQHALEIHRYLNYTRGLSVNIAAISAAAAADMGFSPEQYQLMLTVVFLAGMVPCFLDAKQNKEGTFFPMRCENLQYTGASKRQR